MDFKLKETGMIWESYMTRFGSQSEEDDRDNNIMDDIMGDNYDDDDHKSVVMSFDTSEPVEADHDHDDHDDHSTTERDDMIRSELAKLVEFASRLHKMSDDGEFEEWMAAKITKAADYTSDVYFRLSTKADYANCGCDSEI
jgi:hypothetical protein